MAPADFTGDLDYPMTIVTVASRSGGRAGCLVGFHTQSSINPARWAVMLSVRNHTYQVALEAEAIAVHFPGPADHDLGELFGSLTGDEVDKFERCQWTNGPYDLPLLDRCPNRFVAPIVEVADFGGDHVCFFVEPDTTEFGAPMEQLSFQAVRDLSAGHEP